MTALNRERPVRPGSCSRGCRSEHAKCSIGSDVQKWTPTIWLATPYLHYLMADRGACPSAGPLAPSEAAGARSKTCGTRASFTRKQMTCPSQRPGVRGATLKQARPVYCTVPAARGLGRIDMFSFPLDGYDSATQSPGFAASTCSLNSAGRVWTSICSFSSPKYTLLS